MDSGVTYVSPSLSQQQRKKWLKTNMKMHFDIFHYLLEIIARNLIIYLQGESMISININHEALS